MYVECTLTIQYLLSFYTGKAMFMHTVKPFILYEVQHWKRYFYYNTASNYLFNLYFFKRSTSKSIFFSLQFSSSAVITCCPSLLCPTTSPLPLVEQEVEQLRRTVQSLASGPEPGCVARHRDDCVSTCWLLRFLTGDLLNGQWQIYISCYFSILQDGIRKTRDSVTTGPPLRARKQAPTVYGAWQRYNHPIRHENSSWPQDLRLEAAAGIGHWWLQIR